MCFILLSFNKFKGNNGLDKFESKYWFNVLSEWYFDWKDILMFSKARVLIDKALNMFENKIVFDILNEL